MHASSAPSPSAAAGYIGHVFVTSSIITPKQLMATARLVDVSGWQQMAVHARPKLAALLLLSSKTIDEAAFGDAADVEKAVAATGAQGDTAAAIVAAVAKPTIRALAGGNTLVDFIGSVTVAGAVSSSGSTGSAGGGDTGGGTRPISVAEYRELSPEDAVPDAIKRKSVPGTCEWPHPRTSPRHAWAHLQCSYSSRSAVWCQGQV